MIEKFNVVPETEETVEPTPVGPKADLGGSEANLGYNAGTGADSGGTGAGTTALDAIGSDGNFDSGVADHLKVRHKV